MNPLKISHPILNRRIVLVGSKNSAELKRFKTLGLGDLWVSQIARLMSIRSRQTLADFGAEHVFSAPAMAHHAGCPLRSCEPASARDH